MSKDPAFLFYPGDWLGGTMLMNRYHKGAYMDLLMAQFNNGHMALHEIKTVLGKEDEALWETVLCSKFTQDSDGKFYNEKLETEQIKRREYTSGRKKNLNNPKEIMDYHMDTHMDEHMENENENSNSIIVKGGVGGKELNIPFDIFWDMYDKKIDRAKCEKKWLRMRDGERENCIYTLPAYIRATPNVSFRRNPETYLNNKSWENEIIRHGTDKKDNGATPDELAAVVAKHFATDRAQ